jgi:hypothetical protein
VGQRVDGWHDNPGMRRAQGDEDGDMTKAVACAEEIATW